MAKKNKQPVKQQAPETEDELIVESTDGVDDQEDSDELSGLAAEYGEYPPLHILNKLAEER